MIGFWKNGGKPNDPARNGGDANSLLQNLRQGKLDGFGMFLKICPVSFDRQTCTPLQVFQFGSLAGKGGANIDAQFDFLFLDQAVAGLPGQNGVTRRPFRSGR